MTRNKSGIVLMSVLISIGFWGCDLGTQPNSPNSNTSHSGPPTLSQDVQPIFNNNCAFTGCHGNAGAQANLVLSDGSAYKNTVNVPSVEFSNYKRIQPGSPDSSYLFLKIKSNPPSGARMPYGGPYLSSSQITTISTWIKDGAKNN